MQFELEPDNFNQPDDDLLGDIRRVAAMVKPAGITKQLYDEHGRWCAATMRKRFGNWNDALRRAGIQPTKLVSIPIENVIEDIKSVAVSLGVNSLSKSDYTTHGKYSDSVIYRAFKSWADAARAAEINPAYEMQIALTDEICFEAIEAAWKRAGRQPRQSDVQKPDSLVSAHTITRRFGSWRNALEAFVTCVNKPDAANLTRTVRDTGTTKNIALTSEPSAIAQRSTPRTAGWRLRFLVMRRDSFRCLQCGKSPATDLSTVLVIDHITPWSKGGATIYENLRTLCEVCNGGRSNLDLHEATL